MQSKNNNKKTYKLQGMKFNKSPLIIIISYKINSWG